MTKIIPPRPQRERRYLRGYKCDTRRQAVRLANADQQLGYRTIIEGAAPTESPGYIVWVWFDRPKRRAP